MSSDVEICNSALDQLGASDIIALSQNSKEARVCNRRFAITVDAVLRAHPWNAALVRTALAQDTTQPAYGFKYRFALPTDPFCLRVLRVEEEDQGYKWKVEGRFLLTNSPTATIKYICRITDEAQFDPLLSETIAARLAMDIAYQLTGSLQVQQAMAGMYASKLREARAMNAQEGTPDPIESDTLVDVHRS